MTEQQLTVEERLAALEAQNVTLKRELEVTAEKAMPPHERARRQRNEEAIQRQKALQDEADRESELAAIAAQRWQYDQVVAWAGGNRALVAKWYAARPHCSPPPGVVLE